MAQNIFWFDSTGSFKYMNAGDMGYEEGKGKYVINDNILILNFEDPDTTMPDVSNSYVVNNIESLNDSIVYKINVLDQFDSTAMMSAHCSVSDIMDEKYSLTRGIGKLTDINGVAHIKILNLPSKIKVSFIGYYDFIINVDDKFSRDITVYLIADKYPLTYKFYTQGEELGFKFENTTTGQIIINGILYNKTGEYNDE